MFKNFVAEVIHATKTLKAKEMQVEQSNMENLSVDNLNVKKQANIKVLDAEKILDNGTVYGETSNIKSLTVDPSKNKNDAGVIPKPARVDHTHKIPDAIKNPNAVIIKGNNGSEVLNYDGSSKKELTLTPDNTGSAKKNHASTGTEFGVGNSSNYGHLKLLDSTTSSSDANSGIAATPKSVKLVNDALKNYLPLSGGTMTGAITTPSNAVGLVIGGRTEIVDDNITSSMTIKAKNASQSRLGIGSDRSTVICSKDGDGTLYLRNFNTGDSLQYQGFNPIQERAIVDHIIEKVLTATGDWVPERSGNYRIYVVGGGGNGGDGAHCALGIYDGGLRSDKTGTSTSDYDTCAEGNGFTLPGYGGGGGGVCVVDLYIDPTSPPYKITQETVTDEDGGEYTVDTAVPVARKATFTFDSSKKQIVVTGLDSIAGGSYSEEDSAIIKVYGGSNATTGSIDRVVKSTDAEGNKSYGYTWYTDKSDGTYTKNSDYTSKITAIQNTSGVGTDSNGNPITGLAPDTKPASANSLFGYIKEWPIYTYRQGISYTSYFYIKSGTKWKRYGTDGRYINGYDFTDTQMAMHDLGADTSAELKEYLDGQSVSSYLKSITGDLPALKLETGKYVEFMYDQTKYASQFVKITYGACGIGGYSEGVIQNGISNDYFGGNGDDETAIAESVDSSLPDDGTCTATGHPRKSFGYGGGIPGGLRYIGVVGGSGASGGVKYLKPKEVFDGVTTTYDKDGVRSGSGGSIYIREFGGYCGNVSLTPSSTSGGTGSYGGGGGGGCAIICGNGAGKTTGAHTSKGTGGNACAIIVYLGGGN